MLSEFFICTHSHFSCSLTCVLINLSMLAFNTETTDIMHEYGLERMNVICQYMGSHCDSRLLAHRVVLVYNM